MTETTVDGIKHSIRDGVDADWQGALEIIYLNVTPNYESKTWFIEVQIYSPLFKIFENIDLTVRNIG